MGIFPFNPEDYAFCCSEPRTPEQCSSIAPGPQLRVGRIETTIWKSSEFPSAMTLPFPVNSTKLFLTHPPSPIPTHTETSSVFFGGDVTYNSYFSSPSYNSYNCHSGGFNETGLGVSVACQPSLLPGVPSPSWRHPGLHLRDTAACFWIC